MQTGDMIIEKVLKKYRREQAFCIRREVFIKEQNIAPEEEYDEYDLIAMHYLATINDKPVGTVRFLIEDTQGRIGRMAVLKTYRRRGIGRALLNRVIKEARLHGLEKLYLHAQLASLEFYRSSGFIPYGKPFNEADIPHQAMEKWL